EETATSRIVARSTRCMDASSIDAETRDEARPISRTASTETLAADVRSCVLLHPTGAPVVPQDSTQPSTVCAPRELRQTLRIHGAGEASRPVAHRPGQPSREVRDGEARGRSPAQPAAAVRAPRDGHRTRRPNAKAAAVGEPGFLSGRTVGALWGRQGAGRLPSLPGRTHRLQAR